MGFETENAVGTGLFEKQRRQVFRLVRQFPVPEETLLGLFIKKLSRSSSQPGHAQSFAKQ